MITHKCHLNQNKNYEVKQRYIPTFQHQHIFQQQPFRPQSSRCTPTFHSTVFDTQGYNIKTIHEKKSQQNQQNKQARQSKQLKINENKNEQKCFQLSKSHVLNVSKDFWYDHTKEIILGSIPNSSNRKYSRERKYVDMSSDPVFTDYNYEKKNLTKIQAQTKKLVLTPNISSHALQVQIKPESINQNVQTISENKVQNVNEKQINAVSKETENIKEKQIKKTVKQNKNTKPQKNQLCKPQEQKLNQRPHTAKKRLVQEKPTFTVIRKSRVNHH